MMMHWRNHEPMGGMWILGSGLIAFYVAFLVMFGKFVMAHEDLAEGVRRIGK